MSLPIDFEKATQNDLCPRHKSKADKKRLQRNILRHKWRVSAHLLPQASKYRAASLGCLATTHYYLRLFREEKARVEEMEIMGPHRPWLQSLQHRVRRAGGERAYLQNLLFFARSYLESARRFGELADKFYLP